MKYVDEVLKLAKNNRPIERPSLKDWLAVENDLEVELPHDFKALVSALGTGWFGVGLCLRNPCASSKYTQLSRKALLHFGELVSETTRRSGLRLYPERDGFILIGGMDRQSLLLQPVKGSPEFRSTAWWDMEYHVVHHTRMSLSRFLHDLYLGRIKSDWARRMRNYVWRDGTSPFFTQWGGPST